MITTFSSDFVKGDCYNIEREVKGKKENHINLNLILYKKNRAGILFFSSVLYFNKSKKIKGRIKIAT